MLDILVEACFFNSVFKTKFAHRKCHAAVHLNAFHGLGDVITPGT